MRLSAYLCGSLGEVSGAGTPAVAWRLPMGKEECPLRDSNPLNDVAFERITLYFLVLRVSIVAANYSL